MQQSATKILSGNLNEVNTKVLLKLSKTGVTTISAIIPGHSSLLVQNIPCRMSAEGNEILEHYLWLAKVRPILRVSGENIGIISRPASLVFNYIFFTILSI